MIGTLEDFCGELTNAVRAARQQFAKVDIQCSDRTPIRFVVGGHAEDNFCPITLVAHMNHARHPKGVDKWVTEAKAIGLPYALAKSIAEAADQHEPLTSSIRDQMYEAIVAGGSGA